MQRIAQAVVLGMLSALLIAPAALADADPASDVLLGENIFYPYSPPVSSSLQAMLNAEVAAAHKAGFPIKVALIATGTDLGAIPELFGKPRQYAAFLDQEISFAVKAPLLVVMPDGDGTAGLSRAAAAAAASLPGPSARGSNALAHVALTAIGKLATAAGHPLGRVGARSTRTGAGGSGIAVPLAILIAVCAALTAGILAIRRRGARAAAVRRR